MGAAKKLKSIPPALIKVAPDGPPLSKAVLKIVNADPDAIPWYKHRTGLDGSRVSGADEIRRGLMLPQIPRDREASSAEAAMAAFQLKATADAHAAAACRSLVTRARDFELVRPNGKRVFSARDLLDKLQREKGWT